jgi:ribosomal protein S18 acetylase RimI-like enzyme
MTFGRVSSPALWINNGSVYGPDESSSVKGRGGECMSTDEPPSRCVSRFDGVSSDAIVRTTSVDESDVATVVLAFAADPFVRWLLPDPAQFVRWFSEVTRLHAQRTSAHQGAYRRADGRGAAFWYPPGLHADSEALGATSAAAGFADRVTAVWAVVGELEPTQPHWYLRQIGVDPMLQNRGHGSALLSAGLEEIDRRCEPAYLEATSSSSRVFYERHGFRALGEVSVEGSPPLWPMLRAPART